MRAFLFVLALVASPCGAQVVQQSVDTSNLATKGEVQSVRAIAENAAAVTASAVTPADLSAVAAAIPPACGTVPSSDTSTGSLGTGTACVRAPNASAKTNVMPATAVTAADGSFSGSWPSAFASAPTIAFAGIKSTSEPYLCQVGTFTPTTFSGKCWRLVQMTLPGVLTGLTNLVLVPFGNPPTGSTVMVSGRQ